ncbi:MAG: YfhO family protein [Chloroflexi bacterium]|nr:YfhO family protein [Chloroflexota bacterium]
MTRFNSRNTKHRLRFTHYVLRIFPFLIFLLLLLAFFHKMAFSNLILARGDTFLYFYPYWQAAADALHDGRVPLWNSQLFMGSPFLANSQVGFFYPLNWPIWWLLETPYAVSASILLHLALGGWGAYLAGRKMMDLGRWASLVTAVSFALGGYLTAQVEHINQLQGLAWLPWYLVVIAACTQESCRQRTAVIARASAAFSFLFAMQLLAGHTQTTFISGLTILIWLTAEFTSAIVSRNTEYELRFTFRWQRLKRTVPYALLLGGLLALLLTAIQLLPTLELAQHSSRRGGLTANEVLSFSLHPLLFTRALLPAYGQSLFTEYTAFLPLTAVTLAFIGGWQWRRKPGVLPALVLVGIGLFLVLGVFNPANWLLVRLPGFNLFRVPARWLAIYTLGMALLAGVGFQIAQDRYDQRSRPWEEVSPRAKENLVHIERPLRVALFVILGLMAWNALAGFLTIFIPTGPEAPFETLKPITLLLWLVEIFLLYILLVGERPTWNGDGRFKIGFKRFPLLSPFWLLLIIIISLFLASRTQPYNNLTTPEAYFDLRPPVTRLQVASCKLQLASDDCLPNRFLSLSNIFFDVGDQPEIDTIYQDQLSEVARYDYTVAIKNKEIIAPNLPLAYGLSAVDGFDGGILPLRSYTELMRLILPPGSETTDGRLREHLTAVPPARWLDLFNAQHIITDKTGDTWQTASSNQQDIFFDLQHPLELTAGESWEIAYVPQFPSSALVMLVERESGLITITTAENEEWEIEPTAVENGMSWAAWPHPITSAQTISLTATNGDWRILGTTLINEDDGTFLPLTLGNYRLIYSGDVKIYENLDVLTRAFVVHDWQWQPDVSSAVAAMQNPDFDPRQTAVLSPAQTSQNLPPEPIAGKSGAVTIVNILDYQPGHIPLQIELDSDSVLLLTEAYYPGWQATVNGRPAKLYRGDGYFQALILPAGQHEIVFEFESGSYENGRILSLIGLLLSFILIGVLVLPEARSSTGKLT